MHCASHTFRAVGREELLGGKQFSYAQVTERDRERQRQRQTDRRTDRQTKTMHSDRQKDRHTHRQANETETEEDNIIINTSSTGLSF